MSKMVIVCNRNKDSSEISRDKIKKLFEMLTPPDYTPKAPVIEWHNDILLGIYNPTDGSCKVDHNHAYLGAFFDAFIDKNVRGQTPDGSYFLSRFDKEALELVSDTAAMYTMWYVITPDVFIASSSQRMIVSLLGSFELNREACHFFFCRGALGVGQSWDKRIDHIRGRERIILNRSKWTIEKKREELPQQNIKKGTSDEILLHNFKKDIVHVLEQIKIDWSKYIITLSGGYDSRLLYLLFKETNQDIRTVSWTNMERLKDCDTDGYIAKQLTDYYHTNHTIYYMNDDHQSDKETILNKYLMTSEGRIDHIGAYMDGMKLYESLQDNNIAGFVRGTQVFGTKNKVDVNEEQIMRDFAYLDPSKYRVRENMSLLIPYINNAFGIPEFPFELVQKPNENTFQWGERMWIDYTGHILFGALNGIKLNYIDIIHPYMSKKIIESCWQLPDHLRADTKSGFRKVVEAVSPPSIPYAKAYATPSVDEICRDNFKEILYRDLNTESARELFSKELVNFIIKGMEEEKNIEQIVDKHINPSFVRMGFRAYIILKMNEILSKDAIENK